VTLAGNAVVNPGAAGATPPALSVTCAYPSGTLYAPYSSALVATGGVPPYTYSISAGALPPGLSPNATTGAIAGTLNGIGVFDYTAQAVDSTAAVATASCSITVPAPTTGPPGPPTTPAPGSLILVLTAMALGGLYYSRERLRKLFQQGRVGD
ncbi:MAG: Ig domain-containing protein, partial [Bryobacteraceae bacterium]